MRILVVITGVGDPNFKQKITHLHNNLKLLDQTKPKNSIIDFEIIYYDDKLNEFTFDQKFNIKKIYNKGLVGKHIYNHLSQKNFQGYDHVVVMLDDIVLCENFDLNDMINLQVKYEISIFSPSLTEDSVINNGQMMTRSHHDGKLIIQNHLEYFCYLFCLSDPKIKDALGLWLSLFNEDTQYIWGIDFAITNCLNLKCAMHNDVNMRHLFKGNHQGSKAMKEWSRLNERLKFKYGKEADINREILGFIDYKKII